MLTLTQEDWKRYMTPEGLSEKAGVPQSRFRELIVKELIDNACDIGGGRMFSKGDDILEVHDNGSGVPLEALSMRISEIPDSDFANSRTAVSVIPGQFGHG
jgi:hypothetical protein